MTKKHILFFLIAALLTSPIFTAQAQSAYLAPGLDLIFQTSEKIPSVPTTDLSQAAKETRLCFLYCLPWGMDSIALGIAKNTIERIVDSTVEWINSGFQGNPAYVTNPGQYFTDIADGVAGEFIAGNDDLGFLCSPFQANIRLALQASYTKALPFQCTLTEVVGNIENFYNDFSVGGWDGWFAMTQNSANNPYGAYLEAKVELDSRIATAIRLKNQQLDWGRGFLSVEVCDDTEGPPAPGERCPGQSRIVTPGSVIESQLQDVLGTGLAQLELADEFDELIGALLGQLLEKSVFSAQGLFSASAVTEGGSNPIPTGGTNVITVPTSTWTPPQTANGWWPALSPDGRYVAYGNWGESWVTDLTTGQTWDFRNPPDLTVGHRCISGHWIRSDTLTFTCESDDLPRDNFYRYEVTVGQWTPVRTADNTALVGNNDFRAQDGHWVSWLASGFRLAKDNQVLATGAGGAISLSGNDVVHACDNNNTTICVRSASGPTKIYTSRVPIFNTATNNGYVMYGGYGPIRGITPQGTDVDLKASPSSINEGVGRIVLVNGTYWVITSAWNDTNGYIFLRPWGDKSIIAISASAAYVSAAYNNGNFIVAYNNDVGRLTVVTIPANSTRSIWIEGSGLPIPTPIPTPIPGPINPLPSSSGLDTNGDTFTIDGGSRFLVLASYFDGLDAPNVGADLDYFKSKGIDGVRVFPNWWDTTTPLTFGNTLMNTDGSLDAGRLNDLRSIISAADSRGMVVDVSFARETVDGPCNTGGRNMMCENEYKNGVVATVQQLSSYSNVLYDLQNEFDGGITNLSSNHVSDLKNRVKAADPSAIISASTGSYPGAGSAAAGYATQYGFDFTNVHSTHLTSASGVAGMISPARSAGKAVYLGEPYHSTFISGGEATASELLNFATETKRTGAAVFVYHTRAGFILDGSSFQGNMTAVETSFLNSLANSLSQTAWGATNIIGGGGTPPPPPGGQPASLLTDVQTERAKYGTPMSPAELGTLLNTVAWNNRSAGWGLSRK